MTWRVLVHLKPSVEDHHGRALRAECRRAGVKGVTRVRTGQAYDLTGPLTRADARLLADRLLADPVAQTAAVFSIEEEVAPRGARAAEVWPRRGVTDPVADTVRLAARDLGVAGLEAVRSGRVYDFVGTASAAAVRRFCEEHLMNALVQSVEVR